MMIVLDDFLPDYDAFRASVNDLEFGDLVNPVDNVVYPNICTNISVRNEVEQRIKNLFGNHVNMRFLFMRLSLAGVYAPHQAHSDDSMGTVSLMLYLSEGGETTFLRHKETGYERNPGTEDFVKLWERDTNDPEAWEIHDRCVMKHNRACFFDADMLHRAEPVGGFGDSVENGRLVMTAFLQ